MRVCCNQNTSNEYWVVTLWGSEAPGPQVISLERRNTANVPARVSNVEHKYREDRRYLILLYIDDLRICCNNKISKYQSLLASGWNDSQDWRLEIDRYWIRKMFAELALIIFLMLRNDGLLFIWFHSIQSKSSFLRHQQYKKLHWQSITEG